MIRKFIKNNYAYGMQNITEVNASILVYCPYRLECLNDDWY